MFADTPTAMGLRPERPMAPPFPIISVVLGDEPTHTWLLGDKSMLIGRDPACDIALGDTKASRQHARIHWTNPGSESPIVMIEDLESRNGTWVNLTRISGATQLCERDRVLVGGTLLIYALRVDEEVRAQRSLERRASTDPLTALSNREVFERTLSGEFARARRYGRPLSLLMLDVDDFKKINDTRGHRAGDGVLQHLGQILRGGVRECDVAARYGGEEFAAILPETPARGAMEVAERIRAAVAESAEMGVTVSVGVVTIDDTMAGPDALVDAADRAMYRAKLLGKNRCVAHE